MEDANANTTTPKIIKIPKNFVKMIPVKTELPIVIKLYLTYLFKFNYKKYIIINQI